jgi:hypothetical protein
MATPLTRERLLSLFCFGLLLFNYPLLAIPNLDIMIHGIPLLYAYLFGAWAGVIALAAWLVERRAH